MVNSLILQKIKNPIITDEVFLMVFNQGPFMLIINKVNG